MKVQDPKTGKMETVFQVACNTVMANINAGKLGDVTLESMIKKGAMKNIMKAVVMDAIQKRQAVEVPTYFEDSHGYVEDYETVTIKPMDEKEYKAYQEKEKNRMAEQAKETEKISDEEYIKDFNKEDKEAYKEAQKYASIYDQIWEDYKEYKEFPGFAIDTDKYMKGAVKVFTIDDLCKFVIDVANGIDSCRLQRQQIRDMANDYSDGRNAERTADFIIEKAGL